MHDADLISLNKKDSGKVLDILNNVIGEGKSVCRNADFIYREAIYDDFAVSNEFNKYFAAQKLSDGLPPSHYNPLKGLWFNGNAFVILPTDSTEVLSIITCLKTGKCPGLIAFQIRF